MSTLTPPDVLQCQAEIPNGETAFTLGGGHKMVRCANAAAFIVTEVEPGADGQCGSMSVCDECKAVLIKQMGPSIDKLSFSPVKAPTDLMPAPSTVHTANVFLPGCLGPVKREVVLLEDHQELVDRLAHATRERDQLATAIANAGVAAGICHVNMAFDVPMLMQIAANLGEKDADGERYRWMRDCPWVGHMQAVGITALGDDTKWLSGAEADRAVDAAMAPAAVVPVEPAVPGPPFPFTDRICHKPDCWYCEGSGWWNGGKCTGDEIPF